MPSSTPEREQANSSLYSLSLLPANSLFLDKCTQDAQGHPRAGGGGAPEDRAGASLGHFHRGPQALLQRLQDTSLQPGRSEQSLALLGSLVLSNLLQKAGCVSATRSPPSQLPEPQERLTRPTKMGILTPSPPCAHPLASTLTVTLRKVTVSRNKSFPRFLLKGKNNEILALLPNRTGSSRL